MSPTGPFAAGPHPWLILFRSGCQTLLSDYRMLSDELMATSFPDNSVFLWGRQLHSLLAFPNARDYADNDVELPWF